MEQRIIEACEKSGMNRWTKGGYDRLYIRATLLGIEVYYYKTGNVKDAYLDGERISNSEGRRLLYAKTYIDVASGTVHGDNDMLKARARSMLERIIAGE